MASFSLTYPEKFPPTTSVTAYPLSNWSTASLPPSGAPVGSSAASATVNSSGVALFTGLRTGVEYVAYAASPDRYVHFQVGPATSTAYLQNGRTALISPTTPSAIASQGGLAVSANAAFLGRFVVERNTTVQTIAFAVSTAAGADDSVDVGIYRADGATLTLLSSSGSTSGKLNSTGRKTVALTAPAALLVGEVYYGALACGALGGSAATVRGCTVGNAGAAELFGSAVPDLEVTSKSTSFPLPSSMSSLTASTTTGPALALIE
jgi:hypothetical protein